MKRTLIASILGIAASVATSYGQGFVSFDNYTTFGSVGAQVFLGPATSTPIAAGLFNISLYYQLGTVADPVATGTLIATTVSGSGLTGAGYFNAGNTAIPNYVSGAVTFEITAVGTGAWASWSGHSSTLTLNPIATGTANPSSLDIPSWYVNVVPEPSTFALAGLGAAALLIFRRRN